MNPSSKLGVNYSLLWLSQLPEKKVSGPITFIRYLYNRQLGNPE